MTAKMKSDALRVIKKLRCYGTDAEDNLGTTSSLLHLSHQRNQRRLPVGTDIWRPIQPMNCGRSFI
jgi:hypothetical protein